MVNIFLIKYFLVRKSSRSISILGERRFRGNADSGGTQIQGERSSPIPPYFEKSRHLFFHFDLIKYFLVRKSSRSFSIPAGFFSAGFFSAGLFPAGLFPFGLFSPSRRGFGGTLPQKEGVWGNSVPPGTTFPSSCAASSLYDLFCFSCGMRNHKKRKSRYYS